MSEVASSIQPPTTPERMKLKQLLKQPDSYRFTRMSAQRMQNLVRVREEFMAGAVELKSFPIKLTVEATNICNLRCPACFTGAERPGYRRRGHMPFALYERLIDELGDYLFEVEMHNWGEPLLGKHIFEMIERAHDKGAATLVCTNFSFPFDEAKAERLITSGLHTLSVSIDGANQATYEQYRRKGDMARVLQNCRLMADAKKRLGSATPHMTWSMHAFPHNLAEMGQASRQARDLGMEFFVSKGWVVGPDWHWAPWDDKPEKRPERCDFLWFQYVVNNDGGVAPCCGVFLPEDDFDVVGITVAEDPRTFREIWNGPLFRQARQLFRKRAGDDEVKKLACFDCPRTILFDEWKQNRGKKDAPPGTKFSWSDGFNYFWNRHPGNAPQLIELKRRGTS